MTSENKARQLMRDRLRAGPYANNEEITDLEYIQVECALAVLRELGDVVVIEGHRHHVKAVGFSLAAFGPKAVSLVCQCERGRHALAHGSNSPELRRISVYIASPLRPQETP